jgi:hypothetical protein
MFRCSGSTRQGPKRSSAHNVLDWSLAHNADVLVCHGFVQAGRKRKEEQEARRKAEVKAKHEAAEALKRQKKEEKARQKERQVFEAKERAEQEAREKEEALAREKVRSRGEKGGTARSKNCDCFKVCGSGLGRTV